MTLRAKPVARRRGRAGWDSGDRRNTLINAGFFAAIGIAVVLLVGYTVWSWYDSHFGAAAVVNGQVITKDQYVARYAIESFRISYQDQRIQTELAQGRLTAAEAQQRKDFLDQARNQLPSLVLERLVDNTLQKTLADENGITVSEDDVTAAVTDEATVEEQRHVWVIEVEPVPNPDTGEVGDEEKRTALGKAQRGLARLKAGESWEDVARTVSDAGSAAQAGDIGWIPQESGYDQPLMDAVFAAELNTPTDVIEGEDGIYRIGRATESVAPSVDGDFENKLEDAGIKLDDFRIAVRGDVVRTKLSEKIVADMKQPGPQRHVLEIYLPEPNEPSTPAEEGVKVRWIVYAPNDTTAGADKLKADDPAWSKAKADAEAGFAALKAHPETFDALARSDSDESAGKDNGGKQQWIYGSTPIDNSVKVPVLAEGLQPGQLLEPIRGELGYYVIQFMRRTPTGEVDYLKSLKAKLTDDATFRQAAKDNSEGAHVADGGDLGWIAKGELSAELDKAVFETAIGSMSDVITIQGDGNYLIKVLAEEARTPTDAQKKIFDSTGFSSWYSEKKTAAKIDYLLGSSSTG